MTMAGISRADELNDASLFDSALTADVVIKGRISRATCMSEKPLACTLAVMPQTILKTPPTTSLANGAPISVGWMRAYAGQDFSFLNKDALLFLKSTSLSPYARLWQASGTSLYLLTHPQPVLMPATAPWAPFFVSWLRLPAVAQKEMPYRDRIVRTTLFILTTLVAHPSLTLTEPLPFLEAHPLAIDPSSTALEGAISPLITQPASGTVREQQRFLEWAAHAIALPAIADAFTSLMETKTANPLLRLTAARRLEKIGRGPAPAFYQDLLTSPDPAVLREALTAVAEKKSSWSADTLYFAMRDLTQGNLQQIALQGLVGMGRDYALPRLEAIAVQTRSPILAEQVINALGRFHSPSSVGALVPYLSSDSRAIATSAIGALMRIGTPEALTAVREAQENNPQLIESRQTIMH